MEHQIQVAPAVARGERRGRGRVAVHAAGAGDLRGPEQPPADRVVEPDLDRAAVDARDLRAERGGAAVEIDVGEPQPVALGRGDGLAERLALVDQIDAAVIVEVDRAGLAGERARRDVLARTLTVARWRMSVDDAPTITSCVLASTTQRSRVTSQCARSDTGMVSRTVRVLPRSRWTRWNARSCLFGIASRERS